MKVQTMLLSKTPFRLALLPLIFGSMVQFVVAQTPTRIDDLVVPGSVKRIATGFKFTEGPVWHPDGYLLFSDVAGNSIYKWKLDGKVTTFRSPTRHANGLTFDKQRRLIACEQVGRRVTRTEPDGTIVTLADRYGGKKLNSPNDVVVKSDGSIYFTDPFFPNETTAKQELEFSGVYRISSDGKKLDLLLDSALPNGLAFSPNEKVLYIANDISSRILAFDVLPEGTLADGRVLTDVTSFADGIKVDVKGNLYLATNSDFIMVTDSNGNRIGEIDIPEPTTNCAFGDSENKTLFVTAGSSVYRVQMRVPGVPIGVMPPAGSRR